MTRTAFDPERILATLAKHRVEFVIVGGLAGSVHEVGWPTTDVDIVIANRPKDHAVVRRLQQALAQKKPAP